MARTPKKYKLVWLLAVLLVILGVVLILAGSVRGDLAIGMFGGLLVISSVPLALLNNLVLWWRHR